MTECKCHSYADLMHAYVVMLEKSRDEWKANHDSQVARKRVAGEFRDQFKRELNEARDELARLQEDRQTDELMDRMPDELPSVS